MKAFSPDSKCAKCDNADIGARFISAREFYQGRYELHERIRRSCKRCHYEWDEAPLDAEQ